MKSCLTPLTRISGLALSPPSQNFCMKPCLVLLEQFLWVTKVIIYNMSMATLATHAHHNTNELPARHNVTYVARTNMHAFIITSQFVEPSIIIITFYSLFFVHTSGTSWFGHTSNQYS